MVSRLFLTTLLFVLSSLPSWAGEVDFSNDREGISSYESRTNRKKETSFLRKVNSQKIVSSYELALTEFNSQNVCAFNLNETMVGYLGLKKISKKDFEGAILHLRFENRIDDVVTQILLNAFNTTKKYVSAHDEEYGYLAGSESQQRDILELIKNFSSTYLSRHCYDDAFRLLYADITKVTALSGTSLKNLFVEARRQRIISQDVYLLLEKARLSNLHLKSFGLKDYQQKRSNLRLQFPLSNADEVSDFITQKNVNNLSHRQKILAQYSDLQILVMGNLIKKLRTRLESDRIEIMIYDDEGNFEMIPLDPMERFRFSLKLLRKELLELSINSQFNGHVPSYMDLIASSFEIGLVAGSEIDELGKLEEIWNPRKTLWDKASFWVRSFSSVATIIIPPPYGFIPVLALVAIEATMLDKDRDIDDGSLF